MGETIKLKSADGFEFSAYVAGPANATMGVVVIQEIFGVNHHTRDMADRFGAQRMTIVGLIGMVAGCFLLSMLPAAPGILGIAGYIAPIVVITVGYALFMTANNTAVMADIRADQRGVISGMLSLSRNLGLITGASVMGAVFALASRAADITTARPEAVATGMRITFAVAAMLIIVALAIAVGSRARASRHSLPADAS